MITYESIKSLPDVAKKINALGLKIGEFQLAHYTTKIGGYYALFWDDGKEPKRKKYEPDTVGTPSKNSVAPNATLTKLGASELFPHEQHRVNPGEPAKPDETTRFDANPGPGKDCLGNDLPF